MPDNLITNRKFIKYVWNDIKPFAMLSEIET